MVSNTIDAKMLKNAFLAGAKSLEAKQEWINELNVFPVPDGDTGTNMTMTIMSAAKEVAAIEEPTMENMAKAIASGSLRGARGNSGVILSQLFRGFAKEIKNVDVIDTTILANAFVRGTETAYKAVMKPKEGTILTVAKGMADKAAELVAQTEDIEEFCRLIVECGDDVLNRTPDMLPVLKQAGVVDSGGQGLMQVVKGAFDFIAGKEVDLTVEPVVQVKTSPVPDADIKFGYCTEFIINIEKDFCEQTEKEFKSYLESIGDSIVVVSDDAIIKVHVHTNAPGLAIQRALTYGSLSRIKIDNMREEHEERLIKGADRIKSDDKENEERKPYGFIAVSIGDGLGEIFKGIGADYLIEGGQTMNPSTEDMINAVGRVNADTVYILPNNKNIILAAQQAKGLIKDKKIIVVPSKTIPQGITAIINFSPDLTPEENEAAMIREMANVKTGQITYAVRDTVIDDMEIKSGDIMGIGDTGILNAGKSIKKTALDTIDRMVDEDTEIITIYYGADVNPDDAEDVAEAASEKFPDIEIELQSGGQPIYYYLISAE